MPIAYIETLDETTELQSLGLSSIKFIELILAQLNGIISLYVNKKTPPSTIKCIVLDCDDVLWKGVAGEEVNS